MKHEKQHTLKRGELAAYGCKRTYTTGIICPDDVGACADIVAFGPLTIKGNVGEGARIIAFGPLTIEGKVADGALLVTTETLMTENTIGKAVQRICREYIFEGRDHSHCPVQYLENPTEGYQIEAYKLDQFQDLLDDATQRQKDCLERRDAKQRELDAQHAAAQEENKSHDPARRDEAFKYSGRCF